jgi:triosephosphate isomerase
MRRPLIIGNWKMNLGLAESLGLARDLKRQLAGVYAGPEVMVCPSMPFLSSVMDVLQGSVVGVGSQDLAHQERGAFTGGVGAEQLKELGIRCCILGHSERRQFFGETDELVAAKLRATFRVGLLPVVCFGESEEIRLQGRTESFVSGQIHAALGGLHAPQAAAVVLAYEPIWAIGTGNSAQPEDAEAVHRLVRGILKERFGDEVSQNVRILYGGSVTPENIVQYMHCENIDGALVGGASLKAESFRRIIEYH